MHAPNIPFVTDNGNYVIDARVPRGIDSTPPASVTMAPKDAAAEMAAIRTAIATTDWATLKVYGGLNLALQRRRVLNAACAGRPIQGRDHEGPDVALDAGAA